MPTPTRRENILDAVVAALAGTYGVDTRIYRSRVEPFVRGDMPAIVVEPVSDQASQVNLARLDWTLTFRVTIYTRSTMPDADSDPIAADVHAKIMTDATLQGLAVDILPTSVSFDFQEADQPLGVVAMEFAIRYQSSLDSILSA